MACAACRRMSNSCCRGPATIGQSGHVQIRQVPHVIHAATTTLSAREMSTELCHQRQIALDPGVLISAEHDSGLIAPYKQCPILCMTRIEVAQQVLFVGQVPVRICAVGGVDVQLGTMKVNEVRKRCIIISGTYRILLQNYCSDSRNADLNSLWAWWTRSAQSHPVHCWMCDAQP